MLTTYTRIFTRSFSTPLGRPNTLTLSIFSLTFPAFQLFQSQRDQLPFITFAQSPELPIPRSLG